MAKNNLKANKPQAVSNFRAEDDLHKKIVVEVGNQAVAVGYNKGILGRRSRLEVVRRGRYLVGIAPFMNAKATEGVHKGALPPINLRKIFLGREARHIRPVKYFAQNEVRKICQDRKVRRQVLMAKGKGGAKHKAPTFKLESFVRCK